jgi:hypothetical protein
MLREDVENSILFDEILVTFNCWTLHYNGGILFVYNAGGSPAELYRVRHISYQFLGRAYSMEYKREESKQMHCRN